MPARWEHMWNYLGIVWIFFGDNNCWRNVSDCCLTPTQQVFSYGENKLIFNDDELHFVLDQFAELDCYSGSSLKQQSADRHVAPLGTHYSDSEPTSICFFSLMLRA